MTVVTFLILLLLESLIYNYSWATDYCSQNLACDGIENSGCDCAFGPKCAGQKEHKVTDQIRRQITIAHNNYREKVASGEEIRGGIEGQGASDMYALQYDKELEYTATCWNKKCTFAHDRCRITEAFKPAGQNLYWSSGKACDWQYNLGEATRMWYEEVKDMSPTCIRKFGEGCDKSKVGHFTQLVWAQTTHVGCSLVEYAGPSCQIACNYGPAGNFRQEPVFLAGSSAQCKFKSKRYKHLCLRSEDQESDDYQGDAAANDWGGGDSGHGKNDDRRPKAQNAGRMTNNSKFMVCTILYILLN